MSGQRVARAVVLAAGIGSRLDNGAATPKPLKPVEGVPLLVRVLRTLQSGGIRQAVVVVGFEGERVRQALLSEPSLELELELVQNPDYLRKNGVSLLSAAPFIDRECVLTMADHLYSPELLHRLLADDLPDGTCALAVDYNIERCFDLEDATKVLVSSHRIRRISKELEHYNAIDTGVFRIGPALLHELEQLKSNNGDCSLSEGVQRLSCAGRFFACDIGDARWIDVDTPLALERAEAMIRVFGDALGEPSRSPEMPASTWISAPPPFEDHFAAADPV
ncbi:MAG TPA: NTP transferase domain-containing protein [Polyangiaceae bacterium]